MQGCPKSGLSNVAKNYFRHVYFRDNVEYAYTKMDY